MEIKAVVFDLDNTLYDYDACNAKAEKKLFEVISSEFELNESEAKHLLKKAKHNIKDQLGCDVAASHNRLLYMQNICEQVGKNPLLYALKLYNVYWDAVLEDMVLYDYVEPLFDELKKNKIKIGVLSDLTAHIQYRKLEKLGISERIDCLVTSEEAGEEKPSAKLFKLMIKKLGVLPGEIVMIGDSEKKDVAGAEAVGMKGVIYDETFNSSSLL